MCQCLLCKPVPGKRAHPVYGYDLDLAKTTKCPRCGVVIGEEPYVEDLSMARFGQLNVLHARCESEKEARARKRMEKSWRERAKRRETQKGDTDDPE